ncbi:MAG: RNA polymerase sigma factor [Pseudomonadota bacterium]
MLLTMSATQGNQRQPVTGETDTIARAAKGDTRAYEQLYRAYSGRVYALCLRMTANQQAAEDATQDAFIQAWRKLGSFRGDSAFSSWLHRIAVNVVLSDMRRSKREIAGLSEMPAAEAESGDSDAHLPDIEQAIAGLPARARHVFVLVGVYGYTHEQAAKTMDIAVGTCKAHLHRARQMLADQLDESYGRN